MKFYDISMPIQAGMPVYKNLDDRQPQLIPVKNLDNDKVVINKIVLDLHTGTHVDAPSHYFSDGRSIDQLSMTQQVSSCRVIDLTKVEDAISVSDLEKHHIEQGEFILFKTQNSFNLNLYTDFVYLSEAAAKYLVQIGIKGVGIDGLTIERDQPDHPTHKSLLEKNIMIIEGLRLADILPGQYKLVALPINIVGAEAAPCRVLLVEGM